MSSLIDLLAGVTNPAEVRKYYHIAISHKSTGSIPLYEFTFDLDLSQLRERFVSPYCRGEKIFIKGSLVVRNEIKHIRISETTQPHSYFYQTVEQEVKDSIDRDFVYNGLRRMSPEGASLYMNNKVSLGIMNKGRDVTDELITSTAIVEPGGSTNKVKQTELPTDSRRVFVVHGRNLKARDAMFNFLGAIGLDPIEWSEAVKATGSASPYIGEILDVAFSQAQAVVVLMTPDDEARLREPFRNEVDLAYEAVLSGQARPNVLFEAGMAMARDQDRTVLVGLGSLRPFSDIAGRYVIPISDSSQPRQELAQQLQSAGCPINLDGTHWHTAGEFDRAIDLVSDPRDLPVSSGDADGGPQRASPSNLSISDGARHLLNEAAKSDDGMIEILALDHGRTITTNGRSFCEMGNPRSEAEATSALRELVEFGMIEDQWGTGIQFKVTSIGYQCSDKL